MLRKLVVVAGATLAVTLHVAAVEATVFDFVDLAATEGEGPIPDPVVVDGIGLSASGLFDDGMTVVDAFAYLDEPFNGLPGGLGVCKDLDGDQCDPSDDDNVTVGESLVLAFDQTVSLTEATFRNGVHEQVFDPDAAFSLSIDGGAATEFSLLPLFSPATLLSGETFTFSFVGMEGSDTFQFYISTLTVEKTTTPEPGTLLFIAPGGLALLLTGRRRAR